MENYDRQRRKTADWRSPQEVAGKGGRVKISAVEMVLQRSQSMCAKGSYNLESQYQPH
jgi:hypothetical protein